MSIAVTSLTKNSSVPSTTGSGRAADQLGQADFLRLLTEQLKNQDPLKPLQPNEFLGQLAQFSTVQGIQGLQASFDNLAGGLENQQALQAAYLVGRDALVAGRNFNLSDQPMQGSVDVPARGIVEFEISDPTGQVVRRFSQTANSAGPMSFGWDGITDQGMQAPPGNYQVMARMTDNGTTYALNTEVGARIESVSFGTNGLVLNLAGIGPMPFAAVRRIGGGG